MKTKKTFGKRVLSLLLTLLMVVSLVPMSAIPVYAADGLAELSATIDTGDTVTLKDNDGNGYYDISNANELYAFAAIVNGDNVSIDAELKANIVVNEGVLDENGDLVVGNYREWTPMGKSNSYYSGIFDGHDYIISGLYFNDSTKNYVGLFGRIYPGSEIKNLSINNSYFNGYVEVGGIAGRNHGAITNCSYSGIINGDSYVGGIVGCNFGYITACGNSGDISGTMNVGGIVGESNFDETSTVTILKNYNEGNVSGTDNVGGVIGYNNGGVVSDCYNKGDVNGSDDSYSVGGVIGYNWGGVVTDCYNIDDVIGYESVGGVIGKNYDGGEVTNSYNIGSVSGDTLVSGVVAHNIDSTVEFCYNTGDVNGDEYVGGVVGYNDPGTAQNCYNTGVVSGDKYCGSVVGLDEGFVTNCYYLADSEIDSVDGTTFKTKAQFKSGEVAYLLGEPFGQTIGEEDYPVLGGSKVYCGYTACSDAEMVYSNTELNAEKPDHNYVNGFCTVCDGFEPANYNAEKDCYEIANAGQLYWFADKVNNDNENFGSVDAVLTTNIVVNEGVLDENGDLVEGDYREWTPIGNDDVYYFGTFDGQNYTVSGLYFNDNQTNFVGLFGRVYENGIVKNTGVATSYFCGKERVGGVVALGYRCTIVNCYNSGTISGDWYVGGVVAHCQSITITDCYNTGIVIGGSYIGGVVGVGYDVEITNCHNTNKVSGEVCVGGVSAYWQYGTITNCYNTGEVRVSSDGLIAGGVAGENFESTIVNCYNTGNVNGGEYYAGGVVGICNESNGKIINCYSTGMITCNDDTVGGTVGYCPTNDAIRNCYYLAESENDEIDGTTFKTEAQFKSGEVAVLLQGDNAKIIWGQTIGTDNFPKLGGDAVYIVRDCQGNSAGYGNTMGEIVHSWNNGVCTGCTKACEHSWDNGVCTICTKSCEHNWEDGVCTICETVCEHDWYYGTCDICSKECAHEELEARFEWGEPYDSEFECFVSLIIDCKECGYTVAYESGYGAKTESAEAEDCMHPGYDIYEIIFEVDGAYYSDTKEFTVKSDKHTDLDDNGFCSACGGFEPAKFNEEEWIYEISNAGQLYWYAKELNENNTEMSVVLTKDIVIPENAPNWEPIEASYVTFDGQFHTVSGLKSVHEDYTYVGMFGNEVWWYDIKNLHLTNSYFEGPEYVGGIVASMNNGGTVENCYVTNTTVKGGNDTGTLVGFLGGSNIVNCYVDNDTLVGYHNDYGSIENSYYVASEENENGGKTLEQFKSGEVAYLLQAGVVGEEIYDEELDEWVEAAPEHIWGQTIGEDSYPTLGGAKVYEIENCKGETLYSNTNENAGHNIENGFCTVCDGFEPANYNAEKDCYEIANAGQLYWFAEFVNAGNTSANAVLTADIVVNENVLNVDGTLNESGKFREWTPIGNEFLVYSGTFDGQNHTVSGLYVNNPEQHGVGLVGCVDSNGIVKNTGVVDLYFLAYGEIGGVVGICRGNVTNCYNTGTVVGDRNIGGVVGYTERGNITNCFNLGAVSGNYHTGGVVGYNEVYVTNCYCLSELDNGEYDGTTYKTLDEFKSGEVAYLLGEAFGQTIGEDDYPVLGGAKVYQVTDSDGNVTYTNTNESAVDELAGYSISLGDKIAVNYHMSLTDETLADENAKMVFTVPDTGSTYTVEIPVKDAVKNGDYYVFTYEVAAKEMTSEISAKLVTSESELVLEDYTVQQYAEYIIEQSKPSQGGEIKSIGRESLGRDSLDGEIMDGGLQDDEDILPEVNDYEKAVPLVKAMLNYGAYAQIHFGYNTSNLANANLSEDEKVVRDVDFSIFDYYVYGSEEGVSFYGGALSLKSETAIKLYFVVDGEIPEVTVDGEPYELKKNGTLYELKIADIPAHRLGDFFEVKVGGLTVEYSTFSYAYAVTDTDNEALKDVMNAMYNYCIESHKYSQISK